MNKTHTNAQIDSSLNRQTQRDKTGNVEECRLEEFILSDFRVLLRQSMTWIFTELERERKQLFGIMISLVSMLAEQSKKIGGLPQNLAFRILPHNGLAVRYFKIKYD